MYTNLQQQWSGPHNAARTRGTAHTVPGDCFSNKSLVFSQKEYMSNEIYRTARIRNAGGAK